MELDSAYVPYVVAADGKLVKHAAARCRNLLGWPLVGRALFMTAASAVDQAKLNWDAMMLRLPTDAQYELANIELMWYPRVTVLFFNPCHEPTAAAIRAVHEMTDQQRTSLVMSAPAPPPSTPDAV